jgi:hypothetical protein
VVRQEVFMPILLWYLPFTMFYGTCDLVFAELEMQVNEVRQTDLDQAGPEDEATITEYRPNKVVRTKVVTSRFSDLS